MKNFKTKISQEGFVIIEDVFTEIEINTILERINKRKLLETRNLIARRKFLKLFPECHQLIFSNKLVEIINTIFGENYFIVKSIYFDKPAESNWFVAYHQDITIAINNKVETDGFKNWTVKQDQFAVEPPVDILENNFTIRIHLDDTDENNGALKVIRSSHLNGVVKLQSFERQYEEETFCCVKKGGVMIMKPLLFHASNKTTNNKRRRVLHIEFSKNLLPQPLEWAEWKKII